MNNNVNVRDKSKAITAEDLIRRYNLDSLKSDRKAIQMNKNGLDRIDKITSEFVDAVLKDLQNLQDQVDGNITTWFFSGNPSLENEPANEWLSDVDKINHLGDLYYDKETGYAYRFTQDENGFSWVKLKDSDITEALALANSAQDTADSKRRTFIDTPQPPYDVGDIWIKEDKDLYRCRSTRKAGEYNEVDWVRATDYSNDDYAKNVEAVLDQFKEEVQSNYVTRVTLETSVEDIKAQVEATTTEIRDTATSHYESYDKQLSELNVGVGNIEGSVNEMVKDTNGRFEEVEGKFKLYIERDVEKLMSVFNLAVNQVVIESDNFKLDKNGHVETNDMLLKGGKLELLDDGSSEDASMVITREEEIYGYHINVGTDLKDGYLAINPGILGVLPNKENMEITLFETCNPDNPSQTGKITYNLSWRLSDQYQIQFNFYDYNSEKRAIIFFAIYEFNKTISEPLGGEFKKFGDFHNAIATKVTKIGNEAISGEVLTTASQIADNIFWFNDSNKKIKLNTYYSSSGISIENIDRFNYTEMDFYFAQYLNTGVSKIDPIPEQIERYDLNGDSIIDLDYEALYLGHIPDYGVSDGKKFTIDVNANDFMDPIRIKTFDSNYINHHGFSNIVFQYQTSNGHKYQSYLNAQNIAARDNNYVANITGNRIRIYDENQIFSDALNTEIDMNGIETPHVELKTAPTASNHAVRLQDLNTSFRYKGGNNNTPNNIYDPGIYNGGGSNFPTNYGFMMCFTNNMEKWVPSSSSSWIWQLFLGTDGSVNLRHAENTTTFSSWIKFATINDLNNYVTNTNLNNNYVKKTTNISNQNLNNIKTTGFYYGYGLTNAPAGSSVGYLTVIECPVDTNYLLQEFVPNDTTSGKYIRKLHNGSWTAWIQ